MIKLKTEQIIYKLYDVYGDKYKYDLVEYIDYNTPIKIICPIHGIFEHTPKKLLCLKNGCPKCNMNVLSVDELKMKFNIIHNYKYSYDFTSYKNNKEKIKICCPEHGIFTQKIVDHFNYGCKICSKKYLDKDIFISKANIIHNDKYDYSLVEYIKNNIVVKIICPIHGIFEQTPNIHLSNHGCQKCKESKGERDISIILKEKNIKYIRQYKFEDCKNIRILPFDFYLPDLNTIIEFDGKQHYQVIEKWGGVKALKNRQYLDNLKNVFCYENNIKILRIKYNENILERLQLFLNI